MKFYFAPLEGIGGYLYRNTYHQCFGGMDKYFAPFIAPGTEVRFHKRERRDILPENNQGVPVVPQILTNHAEVFLATAKELFSYGYEEVNLNLGCPSRTVVSKGKGSGFLAEPEKLDAFLEKIFDGTNMKISVKTRIGKNNREEFPALMEIFNRYPLHELIIHPRLQTDYYKNSPDWESYHYAVSVSRNPLCYNGDLFTARDYQRFCETFPQTECVMLGRGILVNPALVAEIRGEALPDKKKYREFHDLLLENYRRAYSGDAHVLCKMKEYWCYMIQIFSENHRYAKKIRKAERMTAYLAAVEGLFAEQEIIKGAGFRWN